VYLGEKIGGLHAMELMLISSITSSRLEEKECEFRFPYFLNKNLNTKAKAASFVAVPLQEAIVEASSVADEFVSSYISALHKFSHDSHHDQQHDHDRREEKKRRFPLSESELKSRFKNFFLGPNTSLIGSLGRVLCVTTSESSTEPIPVVFNVTKQRLQLLQQKQKRILPQQLLLLPLLGLLICSLFVFHSVSASETKSLSNLVDIIKMKPTKKYHFNLMMNMMMFCFLYFYSRKE
jgi:hypothetical protein